MEIIAEMITNTRRNVEDNSIFFILWGWLVLVSAVGHYTLMQYTDYQMPWIFWPILMPLGGILSGIAGYRISKKQRFRTHYDRTLEFVWGGFVVLMVFLLVFMYLKGYTSTYPMFMALYALGSFITGGVIKFRPLIWGAIACWILAVAALFADFPTQLILMAVSIIATYLIPGYMLKKAVDVQGS